VADSAQDLIERLARYPVDRYPVQHATTQFHLGSVQLQTGDTGHALTSLGAAQEVFGRAGMRLEKAKTTVMLGAALRTAGQRELARAAFTAACADLAELDQPTEQAAASFNLGLVLQDTGDLAGARAAWDTARQLFVDAGYPSQASAAARESGASLLTEGDVEAAVPLLAQAMSLAEQAANEASTGAAANALGLALLAAEKPAEAVVALQRALASFPRTLRPAEHAMAKANLALAYEQTGDAARARLAAGQALAVPGAAAPVRAQCQALLTRLPGQGASEDLLTVLDAEDQEQWVAVIRAEIFKILELSATQRRVLLSGFVDGLLARPAASYSLAESLLHVVLELPPRTYEQVLASFVEACADRSDEQATRLRAIFGSAMARFAIPQWQRLAASLNAAADAAGYQGDWR